MTIQDGPESALAQELHGFLSQDAPFLIPFLADPPVDAGALEKRLVEGLDELAGSLEIHRGIELYPGKSHGDASNEYRGELEVLIRGFFRRRAIRESITKSERLEIFRAMVLTRSVDDFLKGCFDRKDVKWQGYPSPQKGFRSTGQEAIAGLALRLRRPPEYPDGSDYLGDVIAPMIRDLGAAMMFLDDPLHPILVQWGKKGTPVDGRDLHIGDLDRGVLPPSAPLAISTQTAVGLAYGFRLRGEDRIAVSFVGDGASSLGEWHEAVNFAAAQRLGMIFVIENNRWALGTHVSEQTATRRFALRGAGYGIPAATVFGNDPDEVAAAATWASGIRPDPSRRESF
jgi:TPP-dependent pyruvate/acetoin dehydrogenase alpha subunit